MILVSLLALGQTLIGGTLNLLLPQGGVGTAVKVTFTLPDDPNVIETDYGKIDDVYGHWSVASSITPGTYDLHVKASHWLSVRFNAVAIQPGSINPIYGSLPPRTPVNGDVNGDNAVTLFDWAAVKLSLGALPGSGHWLAGADLNDSMTIDADDLNLVSFNMGAQGE